MQFHQSDDPNAKPNYFKTYLSNYLAKYRNILESPNSEQRLKDLSKDIAVCIKKFKDENDLTIIHQGRVVTGVEFYNGADGLQITVY